MNHSLWFKVITTNNLIITRVNINLNLVQVVLCLKNFLELSKDPLIPFNFKKVKENTLIISLNINS